MSFFFEDREEVETEALITISPHVAKGVTLLLERDPTILYNDPKDSYVISCAYWLLNIVGSKHVTYRLATPPDTQATSAGQQGAAFVGLSYMIGLVKEPTKDNAAACTKRWSAGLAGVQKPNMLPDSFTGCIWRYIVDNKPSLYSSSGVRRDIVAAYLHSRSRRDDEPPLTRAVLSQLDLVFPDAYLKSVNLMGMFTMSGSRALEIPSVTREAMKLDEVLEKVRTIEGLNYPTCRLMDNSKHPELNHANYPNLYAATLERARRSHKVQRNYLGSKNLIDQAINQDVVRKVLRLSSVSTGTASLTEEQKAWLSTKGYLIPDTPLSDLLKTSTRRRAREEDISSTSSESEADESSEKRSKRKRRT